MEEIFGVDTNRIVVGMVVGFALIVGAVALLALLNRIVLKIGLRNIPRRPAHDLPRWATSIRSDRSDSVNSTLYLMAGISRHGLTKGLCTSLINFSYYINTLWNRY